VRREATLRGKAAPGVLAHDVVGDPRAPRTALFLHGIFGSRGNWMGFARRFVERASGFRAVVVDLRNHGDSHGFAPPHDLEACANDLRALPPLSLGANGAGARAPLDVVVGHSFGGKVALTIAAEPPAGLRSAWILDAAPGPRDVGAGGRGEIDVVIQAIEALELPIAGRRELVEALRSRGLSEPIAKWMTTNLRPVEGGFAWRFDLAACREMLGHFARADLWPVIEREHGLDLHVVRAGRGARFSDDDVRRLAADEEDGCVRAHVMPDAGHWLHTEDPEGLLALFVSHLEAARAR